MAESYSLYYQAKEKNKTSNIVLSAEEETCRRNDHQEILGMKEHHKDQHDAWSKAGNFYNIVQGAQGNDDISRFAIGLSRTIIDTGISMINEGEPEGAFEPLTPADRKINILWDSLMKHILSKSNWRAHQKLWTTDLHIFGSSPLESFVSPVYRRPGEEPGLFLIRLAKTARTGLRHRSIWNTYRNANVGDPDEVPSGAFDEVISYGQWVSKFSGRNDLLPTAKQIPVASKYKMTHIFNELDNTFNLYCLPFGKMAEAQYEQEPDGDELGYPVMKKKLTDLNPLGMCPIIFGTFNDQLTPNYKQHALYGMGIPQLIEGMEMIMEGLFNMTIDNMRLKNTVPVGYQPYQGQTDVPDLDNIGYMDSGRVYHGTFSPTSLGIADLQSNTVLWEWINNICIWLTGYNFQQLGGDTSKTAYEFAQRLKANSNRAASRLKGLETTLSRGWTMTLANTLAQISKDEWEQVTDTQAKEIAAMLASGEASLDDYQMESGKPKNKRFVEYFPVKDYDIKENFKDSKKRKLDERSTDNTLEMRPAKGKTSRVAAVPEHLFPRGDIAQMLAFTVKMSTKSMLGDLRVKDNEAISSTLADGMALMPAVPDITPKMMFGLWKQKAENAGLDIDAVSEDQEKSEALKDTEDLLEKLLSLQSTPTQNGLAQAQTPGMAVPAGNPQPPSGGAVPPASGGGVSGTPQPSPVLQRFGG